jgi:hypothetical protein
VPLLRLTAPAPGIPASLASLTQNLAGTAQDNTWSYTRNQMQNIKAASWTNDSYQ